MNAITQPEQATPEGDVYDGIGASARDQIRAFVSRIERLEDDKAAVMADIKEVYAEAKSRSFDVKVLRQVIRLRKQDRHERESMESLLELYLGVLG